MRPRHKLIESFEITLVNLLAFGFWLALCLLYSLFIIGNNWANVAGIPGVMLLFVLTFHNPRQLAVIWIVGTPTLFIYVNNFLQGVPFLRIERVIVVALLVVLLIIPLIKKQSLKPLITVEKFMLLMLAILGLSMIITSYEQPYLVVKENLVIYLKGFFLPYVAFFIARQIDWSEQDVSRIVNWLLVAGVYLAIVGALGYFFGTYFFYPEYREAPIADRASASFYQPAHFGLVMSAMFFLALYQFAKSRDGMWRSLLVGVMLAVIAGLLLSKTRGPWVATAVGLVFVYMRDARVRKLLLGGGIFSVIVMLAALPYLAATGVLQERVLEINTLFPRVAAYATSLNIIIHNPLTGLGFGISTFLDAKAEYATTFGLVPLQWTVFAGVPHNDFLHLLVLTGLAGFIPFVIILYWALKLSNPVRLRRTGAEQWRIELGIYLNAIFIAYLATSMIVDTLFFRYFLMLVYFLLGVLVSAGSNEPVGKKTSSPVHAPTPRGSERAARTGSDFT